MFTLSLTRRQRIVAVLVFLALAALLAVVTLPDSVVSAWHVYTQNLLTGRLLP